MTSRGRLMLVVLAVLGGLVAVVAVIRRQRLAAASEDFDRRYGPA